MPLTADTHNSNGDGVDSTHCLGQLRQFVNQVVQPEQSTRSWNSDSGCSSVPSHESSGASTHWDLSMEATLPSEWSNLFSINDQVSEVYPLPTTSTEFNTPLGVDDQVLEVYSLPTTSTEFDIQNTAAKTSTWQIQPNLLSSLLSDTDTYPVPTNNQSPHSDSTYSTGQIDPYLEDSLSPPDLLSRPKYRIKKGVYCGCPNCSVEGGNQTYGTDGKLQHNCHIPGCGKHFVFPSLLECHLRSHANDRPFTCSWHECRKKFKSKEELVRHTRTHTNERNFVCPHCEMAFKRSDHLAKHIYVIHESPKPKKTKKRKKLYWDYGVH